MSIKTNIANMRCTVFIDKIIPFNTSIESEIKRIFHERNLTSILLQEMQNIIVPNQMFQSWGFIENNQDFFQIRGNKIDLFANSNFSDETDFCDYFFNSISKISSLLKINIRRLAFAPTYTIDESFINQFIELNFKIQKFGTSATQGFSLSRVFYRSENIETFSYDINYNSNIVLQTLNPFPANMKKQIIIEQDINTKDRGRQFFSGEEIKTFYKNISNLNESYLQIFIGE